ncbi:hypothetical protein DdX_08926 [Ditylenchus destructor]|uniref:Uncharacterized protein n=1 Tax=Ditylenchus destructor TaxID=166010 RepID=A0AAD4N353_9BILA|nr:hypothetical protein DdX_08926 [Ditylenchus destructor]
MVEWRARKVAKEDGGEIKAGYKANAGGIINFDVSLTPPPPSWSGVDTANLKPRASLGKVEDREIKQI